MDVGNILRGVLTCVRRHSVRVDVEYATLILNILCLDRIGKVTLELGIPFEASAFIFPIPLIILALLSSLPPGRNSDPGSHTRLFSPLPATVRSLHFYREISALASLVDLCLFLSSVKGCTHALLHLSHGVLVDGTVPHDATAIFMYPGT